MLYRCQIKDTDGNKVNSSSARLTVEVVTEIVANDVCYSIIDEKTVSIKSYSGSAAALVIPQEIEGYTVVAVGDSAFENNTTLTSIDLPDTIEVIGKRAFANCTSLSEMN